MITFQDFVAALRQLDLPGDAPVMAHASLSRFGEVQGGAESLLGALVYLHNVVVMPGFTYKTMIVPESGPPNNGLDYGQNQDANRMASFYQPGLPVDRLMGVVAEALRRHPRAARASHPILSFVGINAGEILESQTIAEPLKPIEKLLERKGWVLLLGVGQDVNTSIHYAERLAGRMQFVRWALTPAGIIECPAFPGCSDGFGALGVRLSQTAREVPVGAGWMRAYPLEELITIARDRVQADPLALLCDRPYCERCEAVRREVGASTRGFEHYQDRLNG